MDAARHLEEALRRGGGWIEARREPLGAALATMMENVGRLEVTTDAPDAVLWVNQEEVGPLPLPRPHLVPPGTVYIEVRADGYLPVTRPVNAARGGLVRERVALLPAPTTPQETTSAVVSDDTEGTGDDGGATASTDAGGGISPVGPVLLGVGGAALIGGVIAGLVVLDRDGQLEDVCGDDDRCPSSAEAIADERRTLAAVTDALLIGGGVVAATGLILTLVLRTGGDDPAASVGCTQRGCVARLRGRF